MLQTGLKLGKGQELLIRTLAVTTVQRQLGWIVEKAEPGLAITLVSLVPTEGRLDKSVKQHLAAALGWPDRQSYLDARIAPLEAYRWLASQPYRRPLVLDSRVYLAPVPCRILGAEQVAGWTLDDVIRHILEINPDLILWNTHSDLTMGGLLGRAYWLNGEKELLPGEWLAQIEPQRLQSIPYVLGSWNLDARGQVLYMATRFAPVVYHRNGMLATLCPREDLVRFLKDPGLRRRLRRR